MPARTVTIEYNDTIVRQFMLASISWGAIGMLVAAVLMPLSSLTSLAIVATGLRGAWEK